MSKAETAYDVAAAAFIEAKAQGDPAVYKKAKTKLGKARAAWRLERDEVEGTSVAPPPVSPKVKVNKD